MVRGISPLEQYMYFNYHRREGCKENALPTLSPPPYTQAYSIIKNQ